MGAINASVQFAGLALKYPDLYQVNTVVPGGITAASEVPVMLSIAGQL